MITTILNDKTKFKGLHLYYCYALPNYGVYGDKPSLCYFDIHRLYVRLDTVVNSDLFGETREIVCNGIKFTFYGDQLKNNEDTFLLGVKGNSYYILSTNKQDIANFMKEYVYRSIDNAWSDKSTKKDLQRKYITALKLLKKLT